MKKFSRCVLFASRFLFLYRFEHWKDNQWKPNKRKTFTSM